MIGVGVERERNPLKGFGSDAAVGSRQKGEKEELAGVRDEQVLETTSFARKEMVCFAGL